MKILVTGGSGLIGKAIQTKYKTITPQHTFTFLSSKDGDLRDYDTVYNLFERINPDIVIHLAANVGGLYKNMNQKVDMITDNLSINMNVLKCCHLFNIIKCFCCLSTCIFPDKTEYPINESMLHNGPPHASNSGYAYAKRMMEVLCKAYNDQYAKNFVCIIPTNIYGKFDNFSLKDGHVIPSLIHQCYLAKKQNKPFVIKGTGRALRQFIYSEDLATIILYMIDYYHSVDSMVLSVSEQEEVSMQTLGIQIAKLFGVDNIHFDTSFSDGQYKKTADNTKCMKFLTKDVSQSSFTFTPIEEGLKETVNWFIENIDTIRK